MRLDILNSGYKPGTKLLFAVIRLVSRHPVPDAAKLVYYRPDFYGARAKEFTHEAMRGSSAWSVGDRELMAAYVSNVNGSTFCIAAHTATASQAYHDTPRVAAVLADLNSAPVPESLRATLQMLGTLTATGELSPADMAEVLAAGVSAGSKILRIDWQDNVQLVFVRADRSLRRIVGVVQNGNPFNRQASSLRSDAAFEKALKGRWSDEAFAVKNDDGGYVGHVSRQGTAPSALLPATHDAG